MLSLSLALIAVALQNTPAPRSDAPPAAPDEQQAELEALRSAAALIGLEYTDAELRQVAPSVKEQLASYRRLWKLTLDNSEAPALSFSPLLPGIAPVIWQSPDPVAPPHGAELRVPDPAPQRPADLLELAWADIPTLAALIRSRKVTCVELAELSLARLEALDGTLHCVVELTRTRALAQARALDQELAEGHWRGPLHGIPWGAKDLFAVRGTRTTWGAAPFEDQRIERDAAVVKRLDEAGAVLVAKLTLGALAQGDVWFGGKTRNPWKPEQGSSGSSAGPASAVAAGCVPFAIGSETLGSIVSPSARCGNSSLRPTFGRVSRDGAMALSWSMDKLGPLCRSVEDAALVFAAIQGPDGRDPTVREFPFALPAEVDLDGWRVGYLPGAFEERPELADVLPQLEDLGVELVPIELPREIPVRPLIVMLSAEAAASFDELTRDGRDDELVEQGPNAWPNSFRAARFVPAVEYIRADRLRRRLMLQMHDALADVDLYVHPPFGDGSLSITNLTGQPTVIAPAGFREDGTPFSICFTGKLYDEARLLAAARAWQLATGHHLRHPDL